jgi:UDP-3-O-[3-hydroxymyristoyl] glucosamine N-acyltransferase
MKRSLQDIASEIKARLRGNHDAEIDGVSSLQSASLNHLVFVEDEKHFAAAVKSGAGAIIAGEFAATLACDKPLLISDHPKLAFARAAQLLRDTGDTTEGGQESVHPTAVISATVVLGKGVRIDARSVLHEDVKVGDGSSIGAGSAIGKGVKIGSGCEIYPNVTIYPGTVLGNRVIVHAGAVLGSDGFGYVRDRKTGHYEKFPQVGRLIIEDDIEIGANATVDRGALDETRIRRGAKIDNLVHIGHNCDIGEDVVIAAQTGLSGSIVIENGAILGGQVGIGEHARIGEGVMLGGQGGVLPNKILRGKGVAFWGTPAQPLRQYLKQLATLAKLSKKSES